MNNNIKIGISAKFHEKAPVFYGGETKRHIQYLETSIAKWIASNGALPFMIPSESDTSDLAAKTLNVRGFAEEMDALILQGGVDVHPSLYNEQHKQDESKYDLIRDRYELELISEFIKLKKPILGICRGLQLLNTHFGGKLYHDLQECGFKQHFDPNLESKFYHKIRIAPGSFLDMLNLQNQEIVSVHHQGIKDLGTGLNIEAYSDEDNLVESFSKIDDDHFILAVQWHPELHTEDNKNLMDGNALFQSFLRVTKNRKFYGDLSFNKKKKVKLGKSSELTLGVELELQLIDANTFDLKPAAPAILKYLENSNSELKNKIKSEIFQSMIEIETGICNSVHDVENDLIKSTQLLNELTASMGLSIASMGTHPFAKYTDRKLSDYPRYKLLIEAKQWIARRIAIFGLHCHVGATNPEQAIQLYRFYLSVAPLLLGVSASSPFFESEATGLQSVRSTFFESTPSGGHPPILQSWTQFEGLLTKMYKSGAITSHKDLWWDVRPSVSYGTIEIRIADMMPTLHENICLVAFIQALGRCYLENQDHKIWPHLEEWSYRENKWRALRYGLDFNFIINEQGNTLPARSYILELIELCENQISDFGYKDYIGYFKEQMLRESPSVRILKHYEENQSLTKLVDHFSKDWIKKS